MKELRVVFISLFCLSLLSCDNTESYKENSIIRENELLTSLKIFKQAFQKGNIATLESMITDDYVHTNGNSKAFGKDSWLNYLRKRTKRINDGELKVDSYVMDEQEIAFHDDMAIVTGRITVKSCRKGEEQIENQYRVTNIWVYESDGWKRAAFHDGKIK